MASSALPWCTWTTLSAKEVLKDMSKALQAAQVDQAGEFAPAVDGRNAVELADQVAAGRPAPSCWPPREPPIRPSCWRFRPGGRVPMAGLSVTVISSELAGAATRGMALVQVFPDAHSQKSVLVRKFQSTMKNTGRRLTTCAAPARWRVDQCPGHDRRPEECGQDLTRERLRTGWPNVRGLSLATSASALAARRPAWHRLHLPCHLRGKRPPSELILR